MSALKSLSKQTFIYGFSTIIGRFLNYLLVPLYAYKFLPQQYGIVTEYYAYAVVLQIILTYGMETGFFRFYKNSENPDKVFSNIFLSLLTTSLFFLFIVLLFAKPISNFLDYSTSLYTILFAFILFFDVITVVFFAKLRAENKAYKFALYKIINILVNVFFNVFFIIICPFLQYKYNISLFYNHQLGIAYIFISNLIASIITFLIFFPDIIKSKLSFDFKILKNILNYSIPLLFTGLLGSYIETADRIFIKHFSFNPLLNSTKITNDDILYQLGIYGANIKIAIIIILFVQAFRYAAEPFLFSIKDDKTYRNAILSDIIKYYIVLSFVMLLFILQNLDIFKYFISPNYHSGLKVVMPYALSRIMLGLFFILSFWYKLLDKNKQSIYIYIFGSILISLINAIFIPYKGYEVAAWSLFITYSIMNIMSYLFSLKYMNLHLNFKLLSIYSILPIIIYFFSIKFINNFSIFNLALKNLLFLLYISVILVLEPNILKSMKKLINQKFYANKNN